MQNDSKGRSKVASMEKREKRYRVSPVKGPTVVLKCCELASLVLDATDVRVCMEGDRHWGYLRTPLPQNLKPMGAGKGLAWLAADFSNGEDPQPG